MSERDVTRMGEYTSDAAGTHTDNKILSTHSRRRLLQSLTIGSSFLLAGCEQTDSGTPTGSAGVNGQTFRAPTNDDPAKTAFYRTEHTLRGTAYATVAKKGASRGLRRFLRQPGVWINGRLGGRRPNTDIQYNWIKRPIEITPTAVTITIRDDAKWSDDHPITGTDLALLPLEWTLQKYLAPPPAYAPETRVDSDRETQVDPSDPRLAFDGFEIEDKAVTYRSSDGYFERFADTSIALWLGPILPALSPTHIAPFDAYADAVIETARRAQAGEIYPWYKRGYDDPHRETLVLKHLANSKYVKKFSKPGNVVATGRWDLIELDGKEFVFEPNTHHPQTEAINFETVKFEYTPSAERERAALKADRLDYASPGVTPQAVVDSLPEHISTLHIPGGQPTGNELRMNFRHPALGTREVRLALMYALDQSAIAKNIHQSVAVPVTTPGGDCWNATEYVSQDWLDKNFTTYTQDRDKAARLMREAGYAKEGGQWVAADGEPLTLTLPTPNDPPRWEPTVGSQLSKFGITTTVQTMDDTAFGDRRDEGEFAIWPGSRATAVSLSMHTLFIWEMAAADPEQHGIYPKEQFETGDFSASGTPLPKTEERYRVFTIEAPPVGQPDGPLQEYHPAALNINLAFGTISRAEVRRRVKIGMWLANWFLPTIPINKRYIQHFIDDAHWLWPTDTTSWKSFADGDFRTAKGVLGGLELKANPDNPE